uniref:Reverse transcriptase n=1 Tax=Salvator merianae TaxID=96440 RepID=A0A8D0DTF2_SALMN
FFLEQCILYFAENDTQGVRPTIVWEAMKAVLRGKIISKQSHRKKMIGIEREKLELDLKNAEKQHKQIRTPRTSALLEINPDKSEAIFCNVPSWIREETLRKLGIQEQSKKIKYLGISITRNIDKLFHRNYMDLYQQIKGDLEYWKEKKFSLLGKIMVIKMKVLPRILFLYQQIPLKMRIQKKITQKPSAQGGWGMPNLVFYFQATVIRRRRTISFPLAAREGGIMEAEETNVLPAHPQSLSLDGTKWGSLPLHASQNSTHKVKRASDLERLESSLNPKTK